MRHPPAGAAMVVHGDKGDVPPDGARRRVAAACGAAAGRCAGRPLARRPVSLPAAWPRADTHRPGKRVRRRHARHGPGDGGPEPERVVHDAPQNARAGDAHVARQQEQRIAGSPPPDRRVLHRDGLVEGKRDPQREAVQQAGHIEEPRERRSRQQKGQARQARADGHREDLDGQHPVHVRLRLQAHDHHARRREREVEPRVRQAQARAVQAGEEDAEPVGGAHEHHGQRPAQGAALEKAADAPLGTCLPSLALGSRPQPLAIGGGFGQPRGMALVAAEQGQHEHGHRQSRQGEEQRARADPPPPGTGRGPAPRKARARCPARSSPALRPCGIPAGRRPPPWPRPW